MGFDYDAAAETKASTGRKPYLEPNVDFKLLVTKAEFSKGYTGNKYLIEARVLEATATEDGAKVPPVGAERFHSIDLDNEDYGMANLMAFAEGLNGGPLVATATSTKGQKLRALLGEREVSEDEAKKAGSQPVKARAAMALGMVVGNRTNLGPDKDKDGKPKTPFTYMNWYAIKQTMEEVTARRAAAVSGAEVKLNAGNTEVPAAKT